jgi:hypothetical protein
VARRIAAASIEVAGIRGALIRHLEGSLDRLVGADTDAYDFGIEREQLAELLEDLAAGRDAYVPAWRIPREHRPASGRLFWLTGEQLVPADDTIVSTQRQSDR